MRRSQPHSIPLGPMGSQGPCLKHEYHAKARQSIALPSCLLLLDVTSAHLANHEEDCSQHHFLEAPLSFHELPSGYRYLLVRNTKLLRQSSRPQFACLLHHCTLVDIPIVTTRSLRSACLLFPTVLDVICSKPETKFATHTNHNKSAGSCETIDLGEFLFLVGCVEHISCQLCAAICRCP